MSSNAPSPTSSRPPSKPPAKPAACGASRHKHSRPLHCHSAARFSPAAGSGCRSVSGVTRHEYDEEASERLHMDVVHEIDDSPMTPARWIESQRRLNAITDPLARKIIE